MIADGGVDGPGAGGQGGGPGTAGAGGANSVDGSTDRAGGDSEDGCSCATSGAGSPSWAGVLLLALGAVLAIRRRRERR